jgi:hypothetical protein
VVATRASNLTHSARLNTAHSRASTATNLSHVGLQRAYLTTLDR